MVIGSLAIPEGATHANVSWGYLVGAYFLMAIGEMLLAPIGLSLVSHLAPARFTAQLIGFWYVCVGVAFYIGGTLAGFMGKVGGLFRFFSLFVLLAFVAAVALFLCLKKVNNLTHQK
jgi:POT family proton-dependent oligopeptide transporter